MGTHVEVASGKTDLLFDSVAAFVASGRHDHLYEISSVEDVTISDTGHIRTVPSYSDSPPQTRVRLVTKWVDRASETSFNYFLATALRKVWCQPTCKTWTRRTVHICTYFQHKAIVR